MATVTIDQLLEYRSVPINTAASYIGCSTRTLMFGLREGKLPFGCAVRHTSEWSYIIPPARLIAWVDGVDLHRRTTT